MQLIRGDELTPKQKDEVLRAFIYRATRESILAHPHRFKDWTTYRRVLHWTTDKRWLETHWFYIRKDGRLANKPGFCLPWYEEVKK